MSTNLRAIGDRVVVRPDDAESVSPGGIVLPDNAKRKSTRGTVVSAGAGRAAMASTMSDFVHCKLEVAQGDRIIYQQYAGSEIEIDGETLVVLREDDILCVIGDK